MGHGLRIYPDKWRICFLVCVLFAILRIASASSDLENSLSSFVAEVKVPEHSLKQIMTDALVMKSANPIDINSTSCNNLDKYAEDERCYLASFCPSTGLFNFNKLQYCTVPPSWRPLSTTLFILLLIAFFYLLEIVTEDYFCPTLSKTSTSLKMPPDIAGVTLLALGNGAPDVFATFAAMQSNNFNIALGSLIGGGVFITTAIIGAVSLVSEAKLSKFPVLRDIGFFLVAIVIILFICNDGVISMWESVGFLAYYILYVGFTIVAHFIAKRRPQAVPSLHNSHAKLGPHNWVETGEEEEEVLIAPIFPHGKSMSILRRIYFSKFGIYDANHVHPVQHIHPTEAEAHVRPQIDTKTPRWKIFIKMFWDIFTVLSKWHKKKAFQKVLYIIFLPCRMVFQMTIPTAKEKHWNRILGCVYPLVSPLVVLFVVPNGFQIEVGPMPLWSLMMCIGFIFSFVVWLSTNFDHPPRYNVIFIFFAFSLSIVWIYLIANEIVALIQTIGGIFGVSYTILALTVLAWGNSISDLVADVIVARKGIPAMAIAACFAGPLFNTLVGLGIGLIIQCARQFPAPLEVHLSLKLYAGFLFLVVSLLSSLIVVPLSDTM